MYFKYMEARLLSCQVNQHYTQESYPLHAILSYTTATYVTIFDKWLWAVYVCSLPWTIVMLCTWTTELYLQDPFLNVRVIDPTAPRNSQFPVEE